MALTKRVYVFRINEIALKKTSLKDFSNTI